jgi:hypothetical protein
MINGRLFSIKYKAAEGGSYFENIKIFRWSFKDIVSWTKVDKTEWNIATNSKYFSVK